MARVRVREHVNPLSMRYQTSASPPDWTKIYSDLNLPLHLDIGCARGRFLWHMAQAQADWNFLGLEIREPLVDEANLWRDEKGLTNLHYLFCNANSSLKPILETLPAGTLQRVSIQFPDPWFKKKHHKRRVVQQELVGELAIEEVEVEMCDRFSSHPSFKRTNNGEWLAENPMPVATEREIATLKRGEPVYRAVFQT
ncbi:MAG: tRNA (guanosine(46)-N7)-methyltransferase TrmB [Oscillatoriales cyanobacterium]|nr:MAG: tRNA (guanosine(46)-N7)-methyltransferase TrmB [Oscillatoriales cyanobacterium]